jgi:hypothetical protein
MWEAWQKKSQRSVLLPKAALFLSFLRFLSRLFFFCLGLWRRFIDSQTHVRPSAGVTPLRSVPDQFSIAFEI